MSIGLRGVFISNLTPATTETISFVFLNFQKSLSHKAKVTRTALPLLVAGPTNSQDPQSLDAIRDYSVLLPTAPLSFGIRWVEYLGWNLKMYACTLTWCPFQYKKKFVSWYFLPYLKVRRSFATIPQLIPWKGTNVLPLQQQRHRKEYYGRRPRTEAKDGRKVNYFWKIIKNRSVL